MKFNALRRVFKRLLKYARILYNVVLQIQNITKKKLRSPPTYMPKKLSTFSFIFSRWIIRFNTSNYFFQLIIWTYTSSPPSIGHTKYLYVAQENYIVDEYRTIRKAAFFFIILVINNRIKQCFIKLQKSRITLRGPWWCIVIYIYIWVPM